MASEYGWPLDYIMNELPMCQALALYRVLLAKYDEDGAGMSFEVEEMIEDGKSLRAEIASALTQYKRTRRSSP